MSPATPVPATLLLCPRFPVVSETFIVDHIRSLADVLVGVVCTHVDRALLARLDATLPPLDELAPGHPPAGFWRAPLLKARWRLQRRRAGGEVGWAPDVQDRLLARIRARRPEVLLAEFGTIAASGFPAIAASGLPFVVQLHGLDASSSLRQPAYCEALSSILPRARTVLVQSQAMEERLREIAPHARYARNPCGVVVPPEPVARPDADDACRLLMVGRLTPKKAPLHSLEAALIARASARTPVEVDVVGDGPLMPEVSAFVKRHDAHDWIRLHGAESHARVLERMRRASVFVQHSVVAPDGDREGYPVAIMEAAAAGLPCVATRHEGITDAVVEEKTGLLVDEHDVEAMAAQLARLADDPGLRRALGRAAHARARERFDIGQAAERLRAALRPPGDA